MIAYFDTSSVVPLIVDEASTGLCSRMWNDSIVSEVDHIEVTAELAREAGELAEAHGLRNHDAVHLAAAAAVADGDLVLVTSDSDLASAAATIGLAVSNTNA